MHHELCLAVLNVRCALAWYLFMLASFTLRLGAKCLPKDHPGRSYAEGRWHTGSERVGLAMGRTAAARYIASRRRS